MSSASAISSLLSSASTTGTSGIDISNILAAVAGAQTPGINVTSAVSAAVTAAQAPEQVWQNDQTTLSSQMSDLQSIQSATSSLQTDMQNLNSLSGPLSSRTVTSSNVTAVTATAAEGTTLGNHQVAVSNLATTASWYSGEQSNATAALPSGSFTITAASGTSTTINTGSNGDVTLNDVVADINSQNLGITASVITDANGARLSLVSRNSGSAANFTVTSGSSSIGFTQAVVGNNASLTVDGVPVSSATNTVTGAIAGVTLNLLSTNSTGTPVDLSVASNTTQISTAVNQFVTDYNSAVTLLNQQYSFSTSSGTEGDLASDPTIASLQQALGSIATYTTSSASGISSLNDLGISMNTDGTLAVDSTTLGSALSNNPTGVQNFLQGTALNGFANTANNELSSFTDPSDGAFTVDLSSMSAQNTDLTTEINNFQTNYIAPLQTSLTADYTKAEEALQSLPTQLAQIQAELGNSPSSSNG